MALGIMAGLGLLGVQQLDGDAAASPMQKKPMHKSDGEELMMMALEGLSDAELEILADHIHTLDAHRRSSLLLSMAPLPLHEKGEVVQALAAQQQKHQKKSLLLHGE